MADEPEDNTINPEGQQPNPAEGSEPTDVEQPGKEDPQPNDDATPADPPEPRAPEAYEFTVPDGTQIDDEIHAAYDKAARALDLPQEQAQELFATTLTALHEHAQGVQARMHKAWQDELTADKEVGGANLEENLALAKKVARDLGTPDLNELLDGPLGDHPGIVRFLVKVGGLIKEDAFVGGEANKTRDTSLEARASRMYPSMSRAD